MSTTVKIRQNQNLWDLALQELGNIEAAYDIAVLNKLSLTDSIEAGTSLLVPEEPVDIDMQKYYKSNKIEPATN